MKKKPVMPFAAVLAIAAGWLFLTRGGRQEPFQLDLVPSGSGSRTGTKVTVHMKADPIDDEEREARLAAIFEEEDSGWSQQVKVHRIRCEAARCIIEVAVLGDPDRLLKEMENLRREHPWLGTRMESTSHSEGTPTLIFTFFQEPTQVSAP
jgi:hypothetical protein